MESSGLAFYTVKELIDELMRRTTFLGVVVHSQDDYKSRTWNGDRTFQVHFNSNINAAEACRLLQTVSEYMDRNLC